MHFASAIESDFIVATRKKMVEVRNWIEIVVELESRQGLGQSAAEQPGAVHNFTSTQPPILKVGQQWITTPHF